jgi:hypothetical protein
MLAGAHPSSRSRLRAVLISARCVNASEAIAALFCRRWRRDARSPSRARLACGGRQAARLAMRAPASGSGHPRPPGAASSSTLLNQTRALSAKLGRWGRSGRERDGTEYGMTYPEGMISSPRLNCTCPNHALCGPVGRMHHLQALGHSFWLSYGEAGPAPTYTDPPIAGRRPACQDLGL